MPPAVAVAASGGRDSTALLHATARAARDLGLEVHALHVHHGLVDDADAWLERLRAQCRRWRAAGLPVHFHCTRLEGRPARGDSVEAWARRGRYAALASMARDAGCTLVLLAHHRRDQAETLLLQALRGGGPAGLAAMPVIAVREGLTWARPWLAQPRASIEAYVRRHRLRCSDDASNADPRFARNRLRHEVWPALAAAFPDAEARLAAAASRAAEAAALIDEVASQDATAAFDGPALRIEHWRALSAPRRAALLRHWLRWVCGDAPDTLVRRLLAGLPAAGAARWPAPGGECRAYRGRLTFEPAPAASPATPERRDLSRPGSHAVPAFGGTLLVQRCRRGGIAVERLRDAELRPRGGGETFQAAPRAAARSLKKQYQAAGVPAWQRSGPLVFERGELLFVPGLGADARALAAPGAPQCRLRWVPATSG